MQNNKVQFKIKQQKLTKIKGKGPFRNLMMETWFKLLLLDADNKYWTKVTTLPPTIKVLHPINVDDDD